MRDIEQMVGSEWGKDSPWDSAVRRACRYLGSRQPKVLHIVWNPLQTGPFMQNKAKFPEAQMGVTFCEARDYGDLAALRLRKNKAKQSQYRNDSKAPTCPGSLLVESLAVPAESAKMAQKTGHR